MRTCAHPDCDKKHSNDKHCSRLHQRLDNLGIPIPEEATVCRSCGNEWAESNGLCESCQPQTETAGSGTTKTTSPPPVTKRQTQHLEDGAQLHEAHTAQAMSDEEMVEFFKVDRESWEVITSNRWFNGSAWCHQLKCRPRSEVRITRAVIREELETLRQEAPEGPQPEYDPDNARQKEMMAEVMLTDQHIQMLAYAPETRGSHWDSDIAARFFIQGLQENAEKIQRLAGPDSIAKWLFPIGNDLAHIDQFISHGSGGATAKGTVQDIDTRRKKGYKVLRKVLVEGIIFLRQTAPVIVPVIPGNHGPDTEFTLGELLDARFHNDPLVEIRNPESEREYIRHGRVLLGFVHGDEIAKSRLPMLMPVDAPDDWAKTDHREWHIGHTHHLDQRGFAMEAEEDMTIRIRRCPTLAPNDAFHTSRGYKHVRATEAYLWSKEYGFEGLVNSTPKNITDRL